MNIETDKKLWTYHQTDNAQSLTIGHSRQNMLFKEITGKINFGRVLEIGFGDGYLLNKLSKKYECYGADISQENVVQTRKNIKNVEFKIIGVDGKLPYGDDYFDGFVASEVLEHMTDIELNVCVSEIRRILKKDGYIFITVPAEENLKDSECYCPNCGLSFHRWGHKQFWNRKKIENIFGDFEIMRIKGFFTRFEGNNILEKVVGYIFYVLRNLFNKFNKLPNRSYLIIARKNEK